MNKLTPILILILIVGVVSVSGCIHQVGSDDNQTIGTVPDNTSDTNVKTGNNSINAVVVNVNNSGNIKEGTQSTSDNIKKDRQSSTGNNEPKISKSRIEEEIVRIMKLEDSKLNYTAKATLTYVENKPVYIVDVYDDYGWCAYFEVDGDNGPSGNDKDGYSFLGGAVRGETGDEATPIDGVMPKLSHNDAREVMDNELKTNYSITEANYNITGYLNDSTPFYNITVKNGSEDIGTAYMNADTGEIVYINLTGAKNSASVNNKGNEKIYSVDEAGAYVDIVYKGKTVTVRENYPYYSPQDDRVFYSQEEEAESLYNDPRGE